MRGIFGNTSFFEFRMPKKCLNFVLTIDNNN